MKIDDLTLRIIKSKKFKHFGLSHVKTNFKNKSYMFKSLPKITNNKKYCSYDNKAFVAHLKEGKWPTGRIYFENSYLNEIKRNKIVDILLKIRIVLLETEELFYLYDDIISILDSKHDENSLARHPIIKYLSFLLYKRIELNIYKLLDSSIFGNDDASFTKLFKKIRHDINSNVEFKIKFSGINKKNKV